MSRDPPDLSRRGSNWDCPSVDGSRLSSPKPRAASTSLNFPLMVRVCSLNLFSQTRAASMLSSQIVLHTFHWKHVEWLPFWFLVLKLPQNPDFHATHPLMQWRMKFSIDGSRVLPQSVFTDQSCINVILFVVNLLNAFHFGFLFWNYNRIRSFMPPFSVALIWNINVKCQ